MVQLEYHILGDCVFGRVTRPARWNTVFDGVSDFVINSVNAAKRRQAEYKQCAGK